MNGLKIYPNCYEFLKYYLSLMISLLIKALTRGRYQNHYLRLLPQSHSAIPKTLRIQAKIMFVWYPKERGDLKMIHDENDVLTDDELVVARNFLKKSRHACLYIQNKISMWI